MRVVMAPVDTAGVNDHRKSAGPSVRQFASEQVLPARLHGQVDASHAGEMPCKGTCGVDDHVGEDPFPGVECHSNDPVSLLYQVDDPCSPIGRAGGLRRSTESGQYLAWFTIAIVRSKGSEADVVESYAREPSAQLIEIQPFYPGPELVLAIDPGLEVFRHFVVDKEQISTF